MPGESFAGTGEGSAGRFRRLTGTGEGGRTPGESFAGTGEGSAGLFRKLAGAGGDLAGHFRRPAGPFVPRYLPAGNGCFRRKSSIICSALRLGQRTCS
jgi:hypothetical protein